MEWDSAWFPWDKSGTVFTCEKKYAKIFGGHGLLISIKMPYFPSLSTWVDIFPSASCRMRCGLMTITGNDAYTSRTGP